MWLIKSKSGLYLSATGDWITNPEAALEYEDYESCQRNAKNISRDAETDDDECEAVTA